MHVVKSLNDLLLWALHEFWISFWSLWFSLQSRWINWLLQTQDFIGISVDHQLGEITITTSLPLLMSYHVGFGIGIEIIFVYFSVFNTIYCQPMMLTLITWIEHALSWFRITRIFFDNTVGGQKGHLSICIRYSTLFPTRKCFCKYFSMCFGGILL